MFNSTSALQDRRSAGKSLGLSVHSSIEQAQNSQLPPLKSPRGHLLDRIRSTPRTSKFVPHSAPGAQPSDVQARPQPQPIARPIASTSPPPQQQSASRSANVYTPQRNAYNPSFQLQNHDLARADQLALLEQQLQSQNTLLAQQQLLLQQLSYQNPSNYCATPPYTPNALESRTIPVKSSSKNNVVYDPVSGQYYMFAPNMPKQPQFNCVVTPAQKARNEIYTPESIGRPENMRSITPPKEGLPRRQPQGPPAIELLTADADQTINFAKRPQYTSKKSQEAGLPRRSPFSPIIARPSSCGSARSNNSLGSIEEAFPAITL